MLRDAVNNDVEIVRHADTCLVFTDPLPPHGLTWRQMVAWWTNNHQPDADEKSAADTLYRRLYPSLDSPPEHDRPDTASRPLHTRLRERGPLSPGACLASRR
ncbi:hypothetical protein ABTZ93_40305 [Streptomyces sp. NPDC097941]|uniref:hypothetical protein n=1 Tax=Streptomyces sp. NPDC097941 TaxID=3155685 RepID=UPI0033305267